MEIADKRGHTLDLLTLPTLPSPCSGTPSRNTITLSQADQSKKQRNGKLRIPLPFDEAMKAELATSVPVSDDEWLEAARRIIGALSTPN